jgi:ribonuclease HI
MTELEIYIDGASKGNPGHSGIGVVICQGGSAVKNISRYIGMATNNIAEYTALVFALQEALIMRADSVKISTDSQLLYRQINRTYKVKHPNIIGLFSQALHLMSGFKKVSIRHIPREENRTADKLATQAVNKEVKKAKQTNVLL